MLNNIDQYADFIYSLPQHYPNIKFLSARVYTTGPKIGTASGVITLDNEIELKFVERINFQSAEIYDYSYEIRQKDNILYFYDPQPHPEIPGLASTFPHHKHVHPDIKHNRQPAPGISFDKPNLSFMIEEIINTAL